MKQTLFALFVSVFCVSGVVAAPKGEHKGAEPGAFDYYVLALSWSPGYCAVVTGTRSPDQCRAGSGLGFVTHGLWPQYESGYPIDCAGGRNELPKTALEAAHRLYPDDRLAASEWRRHGRCTGRAPEDYLTDVATAAKRVTVPPSFAGQGQGAGAETEIAPEAIEKAFVAVNLGLTPAMMAVSCRAGRLQEVRICFTRDLSGFRACPDVEAGSCRAATVTVPPIR